MKKYLFIAIFIFMMILPGTVSAKCSNQEVIKLQKIANNISYSKTYREENGKILFDITLTNVRGDVYVYDFIKRQNIYGSNDPIVRYGYSDGTTVNFTVRSNSSNCRGDVLRTFSVVLPSYNKYYNDNLCDGITSYNLCNKWYNTNNLSYDDFTKQVKAYREKLDAKVEPEEPEVEEETWQSKLIAMFTKYYIFIFIPIIIIAGGSIYILRNKEEII